MLKVITGSMFSGKTNELINHLERAEIAGKNVIMFKPVVDDRWEGDKIISRTGREFECVVISDVSEVFNYIDDIDVIAFDEIQFFDMDLVRVANNLTDSGYDVVTSGLDTDFRRGVFEVTANLMAIAEEVVKLRAVCVECGELASKTLRMKGDKPAPLSDDIVQTGNEEYKAVCRDCWNKLYSKEKRESK